MKNFITILFSLLSINSFAFDILKDTTISGVWDLRNDILNISAKISGNGIIKNAAINSSPYKQIFETTITLENCRTKEFSAMWFGANPANADNYNALQKAINTCVNSMDLFIPRGNYSFSQPLLVSTKSGETYIGARLNIFGEADMWSDGTTLTFTGISYWAIGFQVAKGGSIHNLKLQGQFVSPANNGQWYYSLTQDQFNDASGRVWNHNYMGLVIDPDGNKNSSGSSGFKVYDMWVTGFDVLYCVTRNWLTQNADILIFTNIRCGNGRIGFLSTQAQAKGDEINNIVSWDNLHTLFSNGTEVRAQAGNFTINGGNIAGNCIRLFNIAQKGWFPSHIYNIYAEHFGQVGTITTGDSQNTLPISINGCVFDFAYPSQAGEQTLLSSNSCFVKFNSCIFRYYGLADSLKFDGKATFDNCFFSGKVVGSTGCFVNYPLPVQQLITQL